MEEKNFCDYGCGKEAKFKFKNGKMCCSKSKNSCPKNIEINRNKNTGKKLSDETRSKISENKKGKKLSDDALKSFNEKRRNTPGPMTGKSHSNETRNKISEKNKGKIRSNDFKENISNKLKNRKFSEKHKHNMSEAGKKKIFTEEHRKNISSSVSGEKNGFFGKHHSNKSKEKLKELNKNNVVSNETKFKISKANKGRKCSEKCKEISRDRMLNGGAIKANLGIKNPLKPQVILFNMVKELFDNSVLNYPLYRGTEKKNYSIDIAILDLKIAIEYDGSYWHQDKEKDLERQINIENEGWRILKFVDYIPDKIELIKKIKRLKND